MEDEPAAPRCARQVVVVRTARAEDLPAISRVRVRSWQAGYTGLLSASLLDGMSVSADLDLWRPVFADLSNRIGILIAESTVAAADSAIVGFANVGGYRLTSGPLESCRLSDSDGEIYALYVDPSHWRSGVGRALMEGCLRWLGEHHHTTTTLWVLQGNDRARRFYESAGFQPDGAERRLAVGDLTMSELRYTYSGAQA
jgi:GNAT superfamily N-acetyltransferase